MPSTPKESNGSRIWIQKRSMPTIMHKDARERLGYRFKKAQADWVPPTILGAIFPRSFCLYSSHVSPSPLSLNRFSGWYLSVAGACFLCSFMGFPSPFLFADYRVRYLGLCAALGEGVPQVFASTSFLVLLLNIVLQLKDCGVLHGLVLGDDVLVLARGGFICVLRCTQDF